MEQLSQSGNALRVHRRVFSFLDGPLRTKWDALMPDARDRDVIIEFDSSPKQRKETWLGLFSDRTANPVQDTNSLRDAAEICIVGYISYGQETDKAKKNKTKIRNNKEYKAKETGRTNETWGDHPEYTTLLKVQGEMQYDEAKLLPYREDNNSRSACCGFDLEVAHLFKTHNENLEGNKNRYLVQFVGHSPEEDSRVWLPAQKTRDTFPSLFRTEKMFTEQHDN
ncbi:hypothetical protein NM208_g2460 [Fusarium decemcellulare]|uniref:Uncharacterized protein n=1 Tax=Fusarium decemcellulare TaxID=57161 RepID=A0ACC1SSN1_9HYPO|nr:hypothetical protein NM208_g2460 [Fusarium decemcellulare]